MEATLAKWGNSLGIRIPNQMASDMGFHAGSKVDIRSRSHLIVIHPKYALKTMYEDCYQKPLAKITMEDVGKTDEMDWGADVGAEVLD